MPVRNAARRRGNALLEFGLVAVILTPLFFGTVNLGLNLGRSVQISQVARDAGHMYVRQLDFGLNSSKDMIVRLAAGLGMTRTGGNGVVILSRVMYIGDSECAAGGYTVGACPNYRQAVFTQRHVIGNVGLRTSAFGTPVSSIVLTANDSTTGYKLGDIAVANYLTHSSARTSGFTSILTGMQAGEIAYVAEAYFSTSEWQLVQSYASTAEGVYARSIF